MNGKMLKILLAQNRPRGSDRATYGMPSSHANSLFYFVGFLSAAGDDYIIHDYIRKLRI